MKHICEIIDNVLYQEDKFRCVFIRTGFNMKKRIFKNEIPYIDIDLKLRIHKTSFKITFLDSNSSYNLFYNGFLKASYTFKIENDVYDIHPHRGRKTSIFKNNQQIAYYEKQLLNRFNKTVIEILSNNDINIDIIVLLIATIDFDFEDDAYTASIDLGSILQSRKFDKEWEPI